MQELLNNILKHSGASFINVTQEVSEDSFVLRIKHDGTGLTQDVYESLTKRSGGLGLKNIQSRLQVLDGKIAFQKDTTTGDFRTTIEIPHLIQKMREEVA